MAGRSKKPKADGQKTQPGRNGGRLRVGGKNHGPHRRTMVMKEIIEDALERVGDPAGELAKLALSENVKDRAIFWRVAAGLLPKDLNVSSGTRPLRIEIITGVPERDVPEEDG